MPQVYIIHGYTASPDKHWFPWLEAELAKGQIACTRLAMPDASNPTPQAWQAYLQAHIRLDSQTILVGHSLGCIAALNFLATQTQQPLGCVFVSGFHQALDTLPELNPFADFYQNQPACLPPKAFAVAALDDEIVPHHYTDALAQHLGADYIRLNTGGHFLDRQGVTELPIVLELIEKLCK
ncbi:esterase [Pasteurellaceae bacterium RH1A]|nr:esterase [Pasteurellaceae bacterium RH1A]